MEKEQRIEKARALHKGGCNCCQAVLLAYADLLPIAEADARNVSAPFGRGVSGCREVCGCVSGMAMVCGLLGKADKTRDLIEIFRKDNGDIVCGRLLQMGKKPCNDLVVNAVEIIEDSLQ